MKLPKFQKVYFLILAYCGGVGLYDGLLVLIQLTDSLRAHHALTPAASGLSIFILLLVGWLLLEGSVRADTWPGRRLRSTVVLLLVIIALLLNFKWGLYHGYPAFLVLLCSVPGYHGMGWITVLAGGVGVFLSAVILALPAVRNQSDSSHTLFKVGCIFLLIPSILFSSVILSQIWFAYQATRFQEEVSIVQFSETPIVWPGFDDPIGIRIEFEVHHPPGFQGRVSTPWIVMGRVALEDQKRGVDYDIYYRRGADRLTRLGGNRFIERVEKAYPNKFRKESDSTRFAFNLYPGSVVSRRYRSYELCLYQNAFGLGALRGWYDPENNLEPIYAEGVELSANWVFYGQGGRIIDLSEILTTELRSKSFLQHNPEAWTAVQKRVHPTALTERYGYARVRRPNGGGEDYCFRYKEPTPVTSISSD